MLAISLAYAGLPPARAADLADLAEGAVNANVFAGGGHTLAPAGPLMPVQAIGPAQGGGVGIRMAGEFEHQSAVLLGAGEMVRRYPHLFTSIVRRLYGHVPVIGVIATDAEHQIALRLLGRAGLPAHAVRWTKTTARTMWIRDYGPLFVQMADGSAVVVDVQSTGNDVPWPAALSVPGQVALSMRLPVLPSDLELQGGNVLTNGEGLFVTTEALMHPNAAAGLSHQQVCDRLAVRLGTRRWLCLDPLREEPTGHVDMFVTFLAPNVAVVAQCDPNIDPTNARILDRAATALAHQATSLGAMQVHRVPLAPAHDGVWRSYTNLILANGVALVPTYADVNPRQQLDVLALYRRLLPGWRVIGIPADDIIRLGGALHCVTMNVPGYVKVRPPAGALLPGNGAARTRLDPRGDAAAPNRDPAIIPSRPGPTSRHGWKDTVILPQADLPQDAENLPPCQPTGFRRADVAF